MAYTLFNKETNKDLIHPKVGLWFTNNLKEAEEMLAACYEYLDSINLSQIKESIVIKEIKDN